MRPILAAYAILIGMLIVPWPASAEIIIDEFLNNTIEVTAPGSPDSVITDDIEGTEIDRQIFVQASGAFSITSGVLDGFLIVDAASSGGPGAASVQIDYLGFLTNLSDNTFFQFNVDKVVGAPTLAVILGDASLGQISGATVLGPTDTPKSYFLDLTQFAGYTPGYGSELNSIQIIVGDGDAFFFVQGDSVQFNSVPEPSSLGLLMAAGALAVVLRRRSIRRTSGNNL